jgi:hypothetical protein
MTARKTPISKAQSYQELAEFWSKTDLSKHWDETQPAAFEVDIQSEKRYYALDLEISAAMARIAHQRGVSAETLLNLWVMEKIRESAKA